MHKDEYYPGLDAGFQANWTPPVRAAPLPRSSGGIGAEAGSGQRCREAIQEHHLAAEKGNRAAQEILGFVCLFGPQIYGETVDRDLVGAHRWLWLAAAQGSLVARHLLDSNGPPAAPGGQNSQLN